MKPDNQKGCEEAGVREESTEADRRERMAETVRQVISSRERAPRSPLMERALKRLIWRYSQASYGKQPERASPAEGSQLEGAQQEIE